jgi:anti-sigma B factor antagonist
LRDDFPYHDIILLDILTSSGGGMEIDIKHYKHCALVSVKGRVDSYTTSKLGDAFDTVNKEGCFKIVLDLEGLEFMSSAGLRTLLIGQRTCKRYNRGEIILASVPKRIYEAIDLAGFIPLFNIFEDTTSAVGYF